MRAPMTLIESRLSRKLAAAFAISTLMALILAIPAAFAHNVDQRMAWIFFDPETQALVSSRAGSGNPIIQAGDELGIIVKTYPEPVGAQTGAGGYVTFYVPPGTTVVDAGYLWPDGAGGFNEIPIKGQATLPYGHIGVGVDTTAALIGHQLNGVDVVTESGLHRGTSIGVYGDTGIFYSTDVDTAWESWINAGGGPLTNNRGETITPNNKWDAEQLQAYGLNGGTIVDGGRGTTPWGLGNVVAGPQSYYAWHFDKEVWDSTGDMIAATSDVGPWQRIQYPGSLFGEDTPGSSDATYGTAGVEASGMGLALSPASPLPATVSLTDTTSTKAVRWSVGGVYVGRQEYVWVKIRIDAGPGEPNSPFDANGCFEARADVIGGDAAGPIADNKDHLWRYYEPTHVVMNPCSLVNKRASVESAAAGEQFDYTITYINAGTYTDTSVIITDTLPGDLTYINAVPAPSLTSPVVWNVGTVAPGEVWTATLTVESGGGGAPILNQIQASGTQGSSSMQDTLYGGAISILTSTKTVSPASVAPGGQVEYTITVDNIGNGPTGSPFDVRDLLPADVEYDSLVSITINGADVSGVTTVDATDPAEPSFSVAQAIPAGQSLVLTLRANVLPSIGKGEHYNTYCTTQKDPTINEIVTICSAGTAPFETGYDVGDTIYRDWNGNGVQDAGEEGLSGVTVAIYDATDTLITSTVTLTDGSYLISDIPNGTYTVRVTGGVPAGYSQSGDPDEPGPCGICDEESPIAVADADYLDADFGYVPGGSGTIGDNVYHDTAGNGTFDPLFDPLIPNVTVWLYEDSNGNGIIDPGFDSQIATTATDLAGEYLFTGLATGINYLVEVDQYDPDLVTFFGQPAVTTTADPHDVGTLAGSYLSADFGFTPVTPSSIGDEVYVDYDSNGEYGPGDSPLEGLTVTLYLDENGDGQVDGGDRVLSSTLTSAAGTYLFDNLPPGDYLIDIEDDGPVIPGGVARATSLYAVSITTPVDLTDADFRFVPVIDKAVSAAVVEPLEDFWYTMTVRYPGPNLLSGITVTDSVPAGTNLQSIGQGGSESGGLVSWALGSNVAGSDGFLPALPLTGTLTLTPSQDTYLDEDKPDDLYAAVTELKAKADASKIQRPLVQFDLSALPDGAVIDVATLRLYISRERAGQISNVHAVTAPWDATTATWNSFGPGGTYSTTVEGSYTPATANVWVEVDLTSLVGEWAAGTVPNYGLLINAAAAAGDSRFESVEGTNPPELLIEYTNPPASDRGSHLEPDLALVTGGDNFNITLELTATSPITNVTPGTLVISSTNGVSAGCAGPSPATATVADSQPFVWVCSAATTGTLGTLTFQADATAANGAPFPAALSQNVLVTPPLTFTVQVPAGSPPPSVNNTAYIQDGGTIPATPSNVVTTTVGAQIGDRLWHDSSGDGVQDGGEPGLAGVTVELYDNLGILLESTVTDSDGNYLFVGLTAGTYEVRVDSDALSPLLTAPTFDADGIGTPHSATVAVASKEIRLDVDFGYVQPAAVGNTLWVDENGNGRLDAGEPGLGNVVVELWDGTHSTLLYTTTTDLDGGYLFRDLLPGDYQVDVRDSTLPAGMVATVVPSGGGDGTHHADPAPVTVTGGQEDLTLDFGYNWVPATEVNPADPSTLPAGTTGAIGDRLWIDANGSGAQEPGELGLGGVTVRLYSDPDGDGLFDTLVQTTATDASGHYLFDGVAPGAYVVEVDSATLPAGYIQSGDPDQPGLPATSPDHRTTTPLILAPGDVYLNADFGYRDPLSPPNSIGDTIFLDLNADGTEDVGEPGIGGVSVSLIQDTNGDGKWTPGEPIVASTRTDDAGSYDFNGIPDGNYLVWVNDRDHILGELVPTDDADKDGGATPNISATSVSGGMTVADQDFGYAPPGHDAGEGLIGDTIFFDVNGNGTQDPGEGGMEGVVVTLTDGAGGTFSTVSNENGRYAFGGLAAGTYTVDVTPPPGYSNSADPDGDAPNNSSVTIGAGGTNLLQDFGYTAGGPSGSIGNLVWEDLNANGVVDGGESGISGVTVDLYSDTNGNGLLDSGDTLLGMTSTDGSGAYSFDGLPYGDFLVDVTDRTNLLDGYWHVTGPNAGDGLTDDNSQVDAYAVTLHAGAPSSTLADFGYHRLPAALGNFIWEDLNGDGIQDPGEPGFASLPVTMTITYPNGDVLNVVTTTDGSGMYSFGNLLTDEHYSGTGGSEPTFMITVGSPTGYQPAPDGMGGDPTRDSNGLSGGGGSYATAAATATMGATDTTYDFGFESIPAAISLAGFDAACTPDGVLVGWETASEVDNLGFHLWRGTMAAGPETRLNPSLIPAQSPGSSQGHVYEWLDEMAPAGELYFWLEDVDAAGQTTLNGPINVTCSPSPTAVTLARFDSRGPSGPPAGALGVTLLLAAALFRRRL